MPLPNGTRIWEDEIDPRDIADFFVDCTPFLAVAENVDTYTLTVLSESVLAGLELGTGLYAHTIVNNIIYLWLMVNLTEQEDIIFNGAGVTLPIALEFTTTSVPPRRKQKTLAIKVAQK